MTVVLGQSIPCTERILRIIHDDPQITIVNVQPQKHILNLKRRDAKGHNVIMDIVATDTNGTQYNLEVQVKPNNNLLKRARYYAAASDTDYLREGEDYQSLPELHITFLTKTDYFEQNEPLYAFETRCKKLTPSTNTGIHIIFVNGAYIDDSPLGRLMHDMRCDNPDEMHYKELRDRCAYLKRTPKGRLAMTGVFAEIYDEGKEKGRKEGREKGIKEGREKGIKEGREKGIKEGREKGRKEGREKGRKEGREKGHHDVALHMLQNTDLSDDNIVLYTGLSLETIQELRLKAENSASEKKV